MLNQLKEMYYVKIVGTRKDLIIRFMIMTAIDTFFLYAYSFIQDILYDAGMKCAYSTVSAYIFILLWVLTVFAFMIITFRDYIDLTVIDKIIFKK